MQEIAFNFKSTFKSVIIVEKLDNKLQSKKFFPAAL